MFSIEWAGSGKNKPRLIAAEKLGEIEFHRIAAELGTPAVRARKTGNVTAKQALQPQRVETRWNGKESAIDAVPGDWILTALGPDGHALRDGEGSLNTYAVREARFHELYEPSGVASAVGPVFRSKGVVEAIELKGGFEIQAPWGELQRADDGWLLLNGDEVYGNHRDTFAATYEITG